MTDMATRRPTKGSTSAAANLNDADQHPPRQRQQADKGQFRLKVDRQTKPSYETYEAAEAAGMTIKTKHPNLQVAVYDAVADGFSSCRRNNGRRRPPSAE
jgi:hypothetical protein